MVGPIILNEAIKPAQVDERTLRIRRGTQLLRQRKYRAA